MINSKTHRIFSAICAILLLFPCVSWGSDSSLNPGSTFELSRDRRIQEKLECMTKVVHQADKTSLEKLCSTSSHDRTPDKKTREAIIDRALDALSKEGKEAGQPTRLNQRSFEQSLENDDQESMDIFDAAGDRFKIEPLPRSMAWENEKKEDVPDVSAAVLRKHEAEFGTEFYLYNYKEPTFNLETEGPQYGIWGAYIYRPGEEDALHSDLVHRYKVDARFALGPVDYSSTPSGELNDEDNHVFEIRGVAEYDHFFNERFLLTGYAGFGFRYLNNDSGGRQTTTGAYGYKRISNYFYAPVGFEILNQITPRWKAVSSVEWDGFMWGKQTSYLSDVNGGYPDLENDQKRGYGARASVRIARECPGIDLLFEPFFRYWHIRDSEVATATGDVYAVTGLEPDNNTTEYGIKFGLKY